jgi:hypothetical protein
MSAIHPSKVTLLPCEDYMVKEKEWMKADRLADC